MLNALERLGARLAAVLQQPLNTSAAIIVSIYTFLWGFWLLNPWWTVFTQASLYSWLEEAAPEEFWGGLAMFCGAVMVWGIVRHSYYSLIIGAFVGFIHWSGIATGYFLGDWQNPGGITAAMIATYCGFVYLNLRVNRDNLHFEKDKGTL